MTDDHHQRTALGIVVAFPVLGGIAVLLRLWSRWLSRSALTADDCLIVVGYIIAISLSVTSWYFIKTNYVGIHIWDVPKDFNPRPGLNWNFANQLLYNPALTAVKLSILLFLRRLDSRSPVVQYLIWSSFAVVTSLFMTVLLVDIFQCNPVAYVYDMTIPGGKCINQGAFYVSTAALNLFTDLMVLSIPIIITVRLQMPLRRKIAVCVILCLGGVATAVGVWRIIILAQGFLSNTPNLDPTYSIGFCSSAIEVNVAVVTACGPSLKAISSRFLPRLLGSSRNGKSTYGAGTSSETSFGLRKRRLNVFKSKSGSHPRPSFFSSRGADYEMADPLGGPRVEAFGDFEMRKYKHSEDISSGGTSDDDKGIVKTTDISIGYSVEPREDAQAEEADPSLLKFDSIIGDKWVGAKSGKRFEVLDPGTEKAWASCPANAAEDVSDAVENSHTAFEQFRKVNPRQRAKWLLEWHNLTVAARDDLAQIVTHETGKPLVEAYGEIDYSLGFLWWFAGEAERIHGSVSTAAAPNRRLFTIKQPIGVAAALVPWNFPIAMVLRKAGAALAAGCTMVVKPSPETPISALVLAELAHRAGFPAGVLNVLTTDLENTPALSEALCKHPLVKKVTFTGSTRVGKLVASHCAHGLKKLTLELGGNCPFLVFDDANLDQAVEQLMSLKWRHAGQACITANRIYVQAGVYDRFVALLKERTAAIIVGHGAVAGTTMGPLTTPRSIDKASAQVEDARRLGADVILGGNPLKSKPGYFFEPTILSGMTEEMLISQEESFAPIAALYRFETEEQAVKLANDTSMGLASYAFTKNIDRMWRLLENLEAGMIGMNTGNSSAAESPFGGLKESGYGKESGKDVAVNDPLRHLIQSHPLIDHHAHNLLNRESATDYVNYPLEAITSAADGRALENARTTLPSLRAINQLSELYGQPCANWTDIQTARDQKVREDYDDLVRKSLSGTHTLLLDNSLSDDEDIESSSWHNSFTVSPTKRIVQIEALAEATILQVSNARKNGESVWNNFRQRFQDALGEALDDCNIVGFKSEICCRTGLDVDPYSSDDTTLGGSLIRILDSGTTKSGFEVDDKQICDWIVQQTLKAITFKKKAGVAKPLLFHTGLGDARVNLSRANPACLQPLIAQYASADIVLLHAGYPYTREAGYLASAYPNVYVDFGKVFPMVSREAQMKVLRESLELAPTDRLLWSTGGQLHPETFWLANRQFRQALETVLVDYVQLGDFTAAQAMKIAADVLFNNSNRLYSLDLTPSYTPEE
ncbi:Aldehyde dehydrogenase, N-terminal [Penicillium italicum]|uniref:Aldehyde dehydrogenase, N-terminal n=1 Tax=Penicillium italicum TaxID=40296 RepID=A0A0A2LLU8_PENIT|nr:Aldehyde dehydrogenase, N-terminal [Penicillium italicum]